VDERNNLQEFVITRVFDAPRDLVWKAFTEPQRMREWWGPKGATVIKSEMDLRPGGSFHYALRTSDGNTMWGKMAYREITPPSRMVFVNSFSDEAGGVTHHPMAPTWPLETLSVFTFEEEGGKTRFTVTWTPLNPTEEERATFAAGHASMQQGWGGTLDKLAAYLAKSAQAA
jgi:uncharacterized protein YndB with AHSA1/START domain